MKKETVATPTRQVLVCHLAKFRAKKNISDRAFCDMVGIKAVPELKAIEDYGRVPRIDKAIKLADAVGIKDLREIWKFETRD